MYKSLFLTLFDLKLISSEKSVFGAKMLWMPSWEILVHSLCYITVTTPSFTSVGKSSFLKELSYRCKNNKLRINPNEQHTSVSPERMPKLCTGDNSEQNFSVSSEFRNTWNGLVDLVLVSVTSWIRNLYLVAGLLPTVCPGSAFLVLDVCKVLSITSITSAKLPLISEKFSYEKQLWKIRSLPERNWCYHYKKKNLAKQQGNGMKSK